MDGDVSRLICTNTSCQYAETGQCVEGNDISECTHLVEDADAGSDFEAKIEPATSPPPFVALGGDAHLPLREASSLMKRAHVPLVAFLGPAASGKTSLIAEVYDAFQYKQYEALRFAGSRTLMAFEEISHATRAASRTQSPEPDRTEIAYDPNLLHLRIHSGDTAADLLLADRSGETYRQILDAPKLADDCLELKRANILNVLVDGERLCDPTARTNVTTQCTQVLQTLALTKTLRVGVPINLVLTKLDIVDGHANAARAHQDFDGLTERIAAQCGDKIGVLTTYKVAACSHDPDRYPKGYGVEALILSWISAQPQSGRFQAPAKDMPRRSFDRTPCTLELC